MPDRTGVLPRIESYPRMFESVTPAHNPAPDHLYSVQDQPNLAEQCSAAQCTRYLAGGSADSANKKQQIMSNVNWPFVSCVTAAIWLTAAVGWIVEGAQQLEPVIHAFLPQFSGTLQQTQLVPANPLSAQACQDA
ncbi:hypothetical protein F4859DRAFT_515223 [Xylaria cf. heliscus]|nr:hypothetical protein F4859DRAFT_515223 [Xylaria cf. heliscus]